MSEVHGVVIGIFAIVARGEEMPVCARTVGGPGAGKTTRALEIMEKCLEARVTDPMRIGFVSFTRAARREASERAAVKFGLKAADLEKEGWFRTLHSIAYRQLGVSQGELIVGGKDDDGWLRKAVHDPSVRAPNTQHDDDYLQMHRPQTDAGKALALWDAARNRQEPLRVLHDRLEAWDDRLPDLDVCYEVVYLYERAKARDGRLDFTDLLMRYAGRKWSGRDAHPFLEVEPQGDVYRLPVWLHDEAQDMSALTGLVFRRLVAPSDYVYLMGDYLQAIYGWAGADGRIFTDWKVQKEEELPTSHRCDQAILSFSWKIIRPCKNTGARQAFRAARGGGQIRRTHVEGALGSLKPGDDVLVLARTNDIARAAAAELDRLGTPWVPTKGGGGFLAPAKVEAVCAMEKLRLGQEVGGQEVWRLMELIPSRKKGGEPFWLHGSKAPLQDKAARERMMPLSLHTLDCAGATPALLGLIARGAYSELLDDKAQALARAAVKHGMAALQKPTVRVGTAHCSPPGEPVLTVDGWVPIQQLNPSQLRIASYYLKSNTLRWGASGGNVALRNRGYTFSSSSRHYLGDLLTIETATSRTRVTPEHRLLVKFGDNFLDKYLLYLMKRGRWWRVGVTRAGRRPYIASGLSCRLAAEGGDSAWVVGVYDTKEEALFYEVLTSMRYGVPELTFNGSGTTTAHSMSKKDIQNIHEALTDVVPARARRLLADSHLLEDYPLYDRDPLWTPAGKKVNKFFSGASVIRAVNFLPGYMSIPVAPPDFVAAVKPFKSKPLWLPATLQREAYAGDVHSIAVSPWEYYISGGAVVHNSSKGLEADKVIAVNRIPYPTQQAIDCPEMLDEERRLWYVVATRARHELVVADAGGERFPEI